MTDIEAEAKREDEGLARNAVGTPGLTFTSIANQSPGSAVALNFGFAVLFAGSALPLALVISLIATLMLANTVIQFSKHLHSARGFGLWVAEGLGEKAGIVTSWIGMYYGLLFPAETTVIMGRVLEAAFTPLGIPIPWWVYNIVLLVFVFIIAYRGVRDSVRVIIVFGIIEISIFLILGVSIVLSPHVHNTVQVFFPTTGVFGVTWGLIYGFLSFSGFESVASLGAEAKNPTKVIGRSAILAVTAVGLFLIFLGYAGVVGWGAVHGNDAAAQSFAADPFPYGVLASHLWPPFQWLIVFSVTTSTVAVCLAATNFASRYVFTLSREGAIPNWLGKTNPRYKTPSNAIIFVIVLSLAFSLILGALWGPATTFVFLATAFTFGWIMMFGMANVALPFYYRRMHPAEFSVIKHVVLPGVATLLLIPAFVSPLLPFLPGLEKAGPVSPQVLATIPLTLIWIVIGIVVASRLVRRRSNAQVGGSGSDSS